MSRLRVAPIIEGHGEYESLRILLERIWSEFLEGDFVRMVQSVRFSRNKSAKHKGKGNSRRFEIDRKEVVEAVQAAIGHLDQEPLIVASDPEPILILIDADGDGPAKLGPALSKVANDALGRRKERIEIACAVAHVEYETRFVAAGESLRDKGYHRWAEDFSTDLQPGISKGRKKVDRRSPRGLPGNSGPGRHDERYGLGACRESSPSFDRLCRESEKIKEMNIQ